MKKILGLIAAVVVSSCASGPKSSDKPRPLFEVLVAEEHGGANFQFYEVLDSEKEMQLLLSDEKTRKLVSADDYKKANFVLLNMGEKTSGGYSITVESARELPDKIVLKIKETAPEGMATTVMTQPYAIVRVNSKKPVEFE